MEACMALMLWAAVMTPYPAAEECPEVSYVSPERMTEYVGTSFHEGRQCYPWAVYLTSPKGSQLVLRRSWKGKIEGNEWREAVLVHEMVHHLQYAQNGHGPMNRRVKVEQEKVAYGVQEDYLHYKGEPPSKYRDVARCGTPYPINR